MIPLRKEYSHQSEMVSQLLYGECYKVIEKRKKWVKIRLEWDDYEGWIDHHQMLEISHKDFDKSPSPILKSQQIWSTTLPQKKGFYFPF
jgi:uncharacterized protein YgiM (DUF1202 family)